MMATEITGQDVVGFRRSNSGLYNCAMTVTDSKCFHLDSRGIATIQSEKPEPDPYATPLSAFPKAKRRLSNSCVVDFDDVVKCFFDPNVTYVVDPRI